MRPSPEIHNTHYARDYRVNGPFEHTKRNGPAITPGRLSLAFVHYQSTISSTTWLVAGSTSTTRLLTVMYL